MPTTRKLPATERGLLDQFDRAFLAYQEEIIVAGRLRHVDEIEMMVELVAYREVSQGEIARWFGYASREAASKRIRPALTERGLVQGMDSAPAGVPRPYARYTDEELTAELLETHDLIPAADERAAKIFQTQILPAASALCLNHDWSITALTKRALEMRDEGGPQLTETLKLALRVHWASNGIKRPPGGRPRTW